MVLEDGCRSFFRNDGTLILGSIAHEKEYWLDLHESEVRIITQYFSSLKLEKEREGNSK